MKAIWNGQMLAESDDTIVVENNHYFPEDALNHEFFTKTDHRTTCPWKGLAHYYTVTVDGESNKNAAWYYPEPREAAKEIKDHVAFWRGVQITE